VPSALLPWLKFSNSISTGLSAPAVSLKDTSSVWQVMTISPSSRSSEVALMK
jgi:hypothetical protein